MKKQVTLYREDFQESWGEIVEGYNFWNNTNKRNLEFVSGTKNQIKEFIKIILPRITEVLDYFPNDPGLLNDIRKLKSILRS